MGAVASALANDHIIYNPPKPALYKKHDTLAATTCNNETICVKFFSPFASSCANDPNGEESKVVILLSHGNADDIGTVGPYCQWLADSLGHTIVTYDYMGYGHSEPTHTSEAGMKRAVDAVYNFATHKLHADKVIVVGKSLGSIPAVHVTSQNKQRIKGLVLISSISSGVRVLFPPNYFGKNVQAKLDAVFGNNIASMPKIKSKVLFVHGKHDKTVPFRNSEELCTALRASSYYPPMFVDADHNDIEQRYSEAFIAELSKFIDSVCYGGVDYEEVAI